MRLLLIASTLLATLLLAACVVDEPVATQDIVSTIPWLDGERAEYVLLDRDNGEEHSRAVLTVTRQNGAFELDLRISDERYSDDVVVLVDAETLKPLSVRRETTSEATTITGEYDSEEGIIRLTIIA